MQRINPVSERLSQAYSWRVVFACLLALGGPQFAICQENKDSIERDYSEELPRFEPLSPTSAQASFELLDGFRLELVASEPLVADPIAFAFDARSRLFVVEMRDYSEQDTECLGRIALLSDSDHDGVMDRRSTFVEGLSWPTAVYPWKDGVLVAAPPKLTWYRDTDDDGVSDTSEEWFDGFKRNNVQGMVNSLRWGVDGLLHGATSSTGAELTSTVNPKHARLTLSRTDFTIDTHTQRIRPTSGGGQHGLSFNRWGDKFVTSNSDHLQQIIDLEQWQRQTPSSIPFPALRRSIATDGPQAEVFRISPIEPWRVVRTRLRVGGLVPGPIEGGGRAAGYFTGATGTWIVDAESGFSQDDQDTALICDVGSNLVHRKKMTDKGLYWSSDRADPNTELVRSTDTWFRPVQLGDGPDGAVYIADMYREVIEHPKSLPEVIKKHLDLTSGRERGRIWRLVPDSRSWTAESWINMQEMEPKELIQYLSSPIAWRRRIASQQLIAMGTGSKGTDAHALLQSAQTRPEGQVLAMHVANRLGSLELETIRTNLQSRHPRVLQHAIQLLRKNNWGPQLQAEIVSIASQQQEDRVLLELALICSELDREMQLHLLEELMPQAANPLVRSVFAIAIANSALPPESVVANLKARELPEWLPLLLPAWCRLSADSPSTHWLLSRLKEVDRSEFATWLDAFSVLSESDLARVKKLVPKATLPRLRVHVWESVATNPKKHRWLRLLTSQDQKKWAIEHLRPTYASELQQSAMDLLVSSAHPETAAILTAVFPSLTPSMQRHAAGLLSMRKAWTRTLLVAIQNGTIQPSQIPTETKQRIKNQAETSELANELFGVSPARAAIIERYRQFLNADNSSPNITQGREHFARVCAQCHQLDGIGNNVGAALKQLSEKTPNQLLEAILDPNREVDPRFVGYSVLANDQTLAGIVESESANQIVLVEAGGRSHTLARQDIERMRNQGKSLMPVGLEEQLSPEQMRDLIRFLREH